MLQNIKLKTYLKKKYIYNDDKKKNVHNLFYLNVFHLK